MNKSFVAKVILFCGFTGYTHAFAEGLDRLIEAGAIGAGLGQAIGRNTESTLIGMGTAILLDGYLRSEKQYNESSLAQKATFGARLDRMSTVGAIGAGIGQTVGRNTEATLIGAGSAILLDGYLYSPSSSIGSRVYGSPPPLAKKQIYDSRQYPAEPGPVTNIINNYYIFTNNNTPGIEVHR